jgi:hypothetical protein
MSGGKSAGIQLLTQGVGLSISVNADVAEIGPESRPHLGAYFAIKRLPATACTLDGLLDLWSDFRFAIGLPGECQNPLHVAISIPPL